ncbi:hypothetical protein [Methanosarcina sp. WH1]|uniref:hypothetical protein n=1 Tax=Methanosarcina sp. WH1 TaxID=1434102 RepID=UPI000615B8AA|nr:hypothetical protein [Methanosarcina sp. WH1]AKB22329.1 Long-chain-fatty-acid--CoA ligase [Methanosarcina sp. WH1]
MSETEVIENFCNTITDIKALKIAERLNSVLNLTDARLLAAHAIFQAMRGKPYSVFNVMKVVRAGATTSLILEALRQGKKIVVIVPHHGIAEETIVRDVVELGKLQKEDVSHVKSNKACLYLIDKMEKFPDLKRLDTLILPTDCTVCPRFDECPEMDILKKDPQVIVLTYHKLCVLLEKWLNKEKSEDEIIFKIMDKILSADIHLFDEIHTYLNLDSVPVEIERTNLSRKTREKLIEISGIKEKLEATPEAKKSYKEIITLVNRFEEIMDYQNYDIRHDNLFSERYSEMTRNITLAVRKIYQKSTELQYYYNHLQVYGENTSHIGSFQTVKFIGSVMKQVELLTIHRKEYGIEMDDIVKLQKIISLVTAEVLVISGVRADNDITITFAPAKKRSTSLISEYIGIITNRRNGTRRVLLTSATTDESVLNFPNLCKFIDKNKIENMFFGTGGDPHNTNANHLVICDNKTYSPHWGRYSFWNNRYEIAEDCIKIMNVFGGDNCFICAPNQKTAKLIKTCLAEKGFPHHVTYYKARDTMGTPCKARVGIMIGMAHKPANTFDIITEDAEESRQMLTYSVHADTLQAQDRTKDSMGKVPSVVFYIGARTNPVAGTNTWGTGRKTSLEDGTVTCESYLTRAKITERKSLDEGISLAKIHLGTKNQEQKVQSKYNCTEKNEKYNAYIKLYNSSISVQLYFRSELTLNETRNEKWIKEHFDEEIRTQTVIDGKTRIIYLEDISNVPKLCAYLSENKYSYILERTPEDKQAVRICVQEISGQEAKRLTIQIKKDAKIKGKAYPNKVTMNRNMKEPETVPSLFGKNCNKVEFMEMV